MAKPQVPTGSGNLAVLLRDDLRVEDSPAFMAALLEGGRRIPLVIISSEVGQGHVPKTARRIAREAAATDGIKQLIGSAGGNVVTVRGGVDEIMSAVSGFGIEGLHANAQVGDDIGFARDRALAKALRTQGVRFTEHLADGLSRAKRKSAEASIFGARELEPLKFELAPEPIRNLRGYLKRLPGANYRRDMWTPGPDATASSRLSIDLACGTLGSDRALIEVQKATKGSSRDAWQAYKQFEARLGWRRSFLQMLEDNVDAFPWNTMREERPEDAARTSAWKAGETGYPLMDAAVRDLAANGWVNFRLRQVLLSFAIDLLDLDMHLTGIMLGELFDDFCPGIHWPQVGLQWGMARGRGPRVINPTKQMRELDPQGDYCRKWLPWLEGVPAETVHEPWKADGYRGPLPVVDYTVAAKAARERHAK